MPRFYIDLRGHFGTNEDHSGIELPDLAAAQREALRLADELLESWAGMLPRYCDEIFIEIINEDLRPVLTIPYSEFARQIALVSRGITAGL